MPPMPDERPILLFATPADEAWLQESQPSPRGSG